MSTASAAPAPFRSTAGPARSCLALAVQVDGLNDRTVGGSPPTVVGAPSPAGRLSRAPRPAMSAIPPRVLDVDRAAAARASRRKRHGGGASSSPATCAGARDIRTSSRRPRRRSARLEAQRGGSDLLAAVEVALGLPVDRSPWEPSRRVALLGGCGSRARRGRAEGSRGRLAATSVTIEGVVEAIDVDDDARSRTSPSVRAGRVRRPDRSAALHTLSLDESTLAMGVERSHRHGRRPDHEARSSGCTPPPKHGSRPSARRSDPGPRSPRATIEDAGARAAAARPQSHRVGRVAGLARVQEAPMTTVTTQRGSFIGQSVLRVEDRGISPAPRRSAATSIARTSSTRGSCEARSPPGASPPSTWRPRWSIRRSSRVLTRG